METIMSIRTTQREIRAMPADLDVTNWPSEDVYDLIRTDRKYTEVAYSTGVYGINAVVVRLESGRFVKSTSTNSNTFILA